ncbi:MAG: hypothetical protein KJ896_03995, partial [Nanoarchaeota archaeon]|nr:hypothetical protein [Nanoarchaeota archaeon]
MKLKILIGIVMIIMLMLSGIVVAQDSEESSNNCSGFFGSIKCFLFGNRDSALVGQAGNANGTETYEEAIIPTETITVTYKDSNDNILIRDYDLYNGDGASGTVTINNDDQSYDQKWIRQDGTNYYALFVDDTGQVIAYQEGVKEADLDTNKGAKGYNTVPSTEDNKAAYYFQEGWKQ